MQIWHTATAVFFIFLFMLAALSYLGWRGAGQKRQGFACRPNQDVALPALSTTFSRKKPQWVMLEVLRIKALMGKNAGCRKVADTFNRLHTPMSVGKSFVSDAIKKHQYLLLNISRELRDKKPRPTQINAVWGLDLTFVRESQSIQRTVFGAIDHESRVCTRLVMVLNKRSWTLIGHLCLAIGSFFALPKTQADRQANGDPRLSLVERYKDNAGYVAQVTAAVAKLVSERFLVQDDADAYIVSAKAADFVPVLPADPVATRGGGCTMSPVGGGVFDPTLILLAILALALIVGRRSSRGTGKM